MGISFEQLQITQTYVDKLTQLGIGEATPIQAEGIPVLLEGKDAIIQSQTGTGKTLAYLLPALERIDPAVKQLQVLVVVPTRELGMQIMQEIEKLTSGGPIRSQSLIGGAAVARQIEKLRLHPHIVVGTPGRLLELMKVRKLTLHHVKVGIIDEVDQVFELGSMQDVEAVLKGMLRSSQMVFVSATIPPSTEQAAGRWLKNPVIIKINPTQRTAETLEHHYVVCQEREKIDTLRRLVRMIKPKSAIVFINVTDDIAQVVAKLQFVGLSIEALYGEASKQDRAKVMGNFRDGKFQLLLATDVAARGLDIEGVTHVFHLDVATNAEYYLHRVGRTGRMGREGTSISIVTTKELFIIEKFEKQLGITIEPKSLYEGRLVDPAQDRSAAAMRSRREAARPSGAPTRGSSAGSRDAAAPAGAVRVSAATPSEARSPRDAAPAKPAAAGVKPAGGGKAVSKAQRERDRKSKGAPRWLKEKQQNKEE
ncbi:DEAD/DEAH box helicase [Paenibacillus roseipurpureus]|uniref:DEAD/DEAH box helicase n=1 Tax=Paenibacillus roseopurpureus TaxID=2918901 RepID=A0AA96LTH7_9BACL|nr:DEAD/DEAH box helicase [Paenibacillus sp. MBLB1832]WNR45703.1 DEAD/DEAH box helicase [Paenibacillus sp. MBLB1832]